MDKENINKANGNENDQNNDSSMGINAPAFSLNIDSIDHKTTQFKKEEGIQENSKDGFSSLSFDTGDANLPSDNPSLNTISQAQAPVFQLKSSGPSGMPSETLNQMSSSFGQDFSDVNIHSGSQSAVDAGALAYTQGNDIHFAPGQYDPSSQSGQELLGHELTHVVQQREGRVQANNEVNGMPLNDDKGLEHEADMMGAKAAQMKLTNSESYLNTADKTQRGSQLLQKKSNPIQRVVTSQTLPDGVMDVKMPITKNSGNVIGVKGTVIFTPNTKAPYSNKIGMIQIVKLTDKSGDVNPASLPAVGQGDPKTGVRTAEDKKAGVEGGFFTDILHQNFGPGGVIAKKGSNALPYYQGGTPVFGFKRSEDPQDIKAAELSDFPSWDQESDFSFETVAKGDDNSHVFGAVKWSFQIRKDGSGVPQVVNETSSFQAGQSATFDAALEKHREFYVLEPLTLYFETGASVLDSTERGKIATAKSYMVANPDVKMKITGFADLKGTEKNNTILATKRALQVQGDLIADLGVSADRVSGVFQGGETAAFTADAKAGRGQELEANLKGNRRVTVEFEHVVPTKKGP